ncbi:MAG: cytochrome P450 [Marmoricola sp.]
MTLLKLSAPTEPARRPREAWDRARTETRTLVHWGTAHGVPRMALRTSARRGDLQGRLVEAGSSSDDTALWRVIEEIRRDGPLHRSRLAHVTVDHAVVKEVLTSPDFGAGMPGRTDGWLARLADWSTSGAVSPVEPPSLLVTEPPDHTRYRKLVTRVFTARAVERLRERTEQIATELLDAMDGADDVDLVASYCSLLPVTVIAEILGVPPEERERVLSMGTAAAASLDVGLPWRQFRSVDSALSQFDAWLDGHLDKLRRNPGDNLLSQLVAVRDEGTGLTDTELKSTAGLVLAAGFETTVNLLGNGVALLREHPDQLERLRREPQLWPNAVEEVLRVDPPVLLTGRVCVRDTTVAGVPVHEGGLVTTVLAGANRDPQVFADPTRFDVARENARDHIAFSAGRHHCLGASLARMEGAVGLRALFDRYPDLALEPGAHRRSTRILRGYEVLPARLHGSRTPA